MAKIKLNIKNTQLAQALQVGKPKLPAKAKEAPAKSKKEEEEAALKKRKTRIVPQKSAEEEEALEQAQEQEATSLEKTEVKEEAAQAPQETSPEAPKPTPLSKEQDAQPKKVAEEPKKPQVKREDAPPSPQQPSAPPPPKKELRISPKKKEVRTFDARDRQGLRDIENEAWRKRRAFKAKKRVEEQVIRPKAISVRLPIAIKDLAHEMKLKSTQLIAKLFMKGMTLTLNDYLDDETTVQLLGHDFDCEITIDTSEQERIRITDQTIRQEVQATDSHALTLRSPVVAFMGHVDHGKTSLIDSIRKSNRAAAEAGAITQHIGAFCVHTNGGDVTILDTPGHEAFTEMRSRGANVTDIVILVIAGDEGIRAQTDEAIRQAQEASVPILVAINKCDKPSFDPQKVYRELADRELLPEAWGGTTITVNCSATTGEGVKELLEMIALQAEIQELRANPATRARGTILESEMHKGMGAVATVLVQNGTLRKNDAIVFGHFSGRIKTMQDDAGRHVETAGPSTPVKITGLSELAEAGEEFIVVKNEKEARSLAEARIAGHQRSLLTQAKISSLDKMMAKRESGEMKILPLILRADVQGSLEALRNSLLKIKSKKVRLEFVNEGVGEISESDIDLASASKATIVGFHTRVESRADDLIKQKKVSVIENDIIYHLVDEVKVRMRSLLEKMEKEEELGEAYVKAVFKSSQLGLIAGCQVTDGILKRGCLVRQLRNKEVIWKGKISSLKRVKEDVKEVSKGIECGILLDGQSDIKENDVLQAYEITYLEQEL